MRDRGACPPSLSVTNAPETAAPDGSETTPRIDVCWPAAIEGKHRSASSAVVRKLKMNWDRVLDRVCFISAIVSGLHQDSAFTSRRSEISPRVATRTKDSVRTSLWEASMISQLSCKSIELWFAGAVSMSGRSLMIQAFGRRLRTAAAGNPSRHRLALNAARGKAGTKQAPGFDQRRLGLGFRPPPDGITVSPPGTPTPSGRTSV